ncbi:MAG: hypothetical protein OQJ96_06125 [Flavobacteriales bacterium]|nr:hypothetical protein [Flavobacteriales bacterium]MCW8937655.1 hypothetical protein [Flavobacteriales bacterium]MCW8967583.1 hypothetical protein [Flavobacteriales bacterium]MCW8990143.1 hypothetical protein [Flavobacteriales bacterium]MCW9019861.1 hypothetical protein [Flavobacteriales bacterium]
MENKKSKHITSDNISQWISSLGFSFPRNETEERVFDKLYANFEYKLTGKELNIGKLIEEVESEEQEVKMIRDSSNWKMAARNIDNSNLPEHILKKMIKNQNGKN